MSIWSVKYRIGRASSRQKERAPGVRPRSGSPSCEQDGSKAYCQGANTNNIATRRGGSNLIYRPAIAFWGNRRPFETETTAWVFIQRYRPLGKRSLIPRSTECSTLGAVEAHQNTPGHRSSTPFSIPQNPAPTDLSRVFDFSRIRCSISSESARPVRHNQECTRENRCSVAERLLELPCIHQRTAE